MRALRDYLCEVPAKSSESSGLTTFVVGYKPSVACDSKGMAD